MQEELTNVAYHLLSAYVLPGKAYDVLEDLACQHIRTRDASASTSRLKISAISAAASALHEAQKKIDRECRASNPVIPVNWSELEMQA